LLDEWEQVHASVAKIDVHEVGTVPRQQRIERLILTPINDRRAPFHEFQPTVDEQIRASLWNNLYIGERKSLGVLNLLGHDKSVDPAKRLYLPVNMQHLRLEKAGAIARYN
jgi:hypothetical protein